LFLFHLFPSPSLQQQQQQQQQFPQQQQQKQFPQQFRFFSSFQLLKSQGFEEGSFDFHSAAAAEGIFTIRNNIGSFRRCCSFRISSFQTQQQAPAKEWAFFKFFFSLSSCSFLTPNKKPEQKLQ